MSGILYWTAFPTSQPDPTASQIVAGSGWAGSVAAGNAPAITSTGLQTFPAVAIPIVGTYKVAFVYYDGTAYSNVIVSSAVTVTEADISYPLWVQTIQSSEKLEDNIPTERSSNGTLHARVMWGAPARVFEVHHVLTRSQMEHLDTFYTSKRGRVFNFVWGRNRATYPVAFRSPPSYEQLGANMFKVQAVMETV